MATPLEVVGEIQVEPCAGPPQDAEAITSQALVFCRDMKVKVPAGHDIAR